MRKFSYPCAAAIVLSVFLCACPRETITGSAKGPYLVKVNNSVITESDVREEMDMLPADVKEMFQEEGGMESLIEELAKKEMLYLEAVKRGMHKKDVIEKRLKVLKKRLIVEMLIEEEIEKTTSVSEEETKGFYDANKEKFMAEVPGKKKPEAIEFEVVKDIIRQRLTAQKQREAFEKYIVSLEKKYSVDLNREAIRAAFGNKPTP